MALDLCHREGARQYIIIRARKKALSVYLLHIEGKTQALKLLTKIPSSALNFHDLSQFKARDLDSFRQLLVQHIGEEMRYITEIQKRQHKVLPGKK